MDRDPVRDISGNKISVRLSWAAGDGGFLGGVLLDLSQWRTASAASAVAREKVGLATDGRGGCTGHGARAAHLPSTRNSRQVLLVAWRTNGSCHDASLHQARPIRKALFNTVCYPESERESIQLPLAECLERFKVLHSIITRMDYSSTRLTSVVLE
jgi:hypothetical protein